MKQYEMKEAYEIVFADLISNYGGLPVGIYDAKNGNPHFMYGIELIMELIAFNADKQELFENIFNNNMIESEKRANGNK